MVWTQADLDAIRTAIARGEKAVRFADREVVYQTVADLLAAEGRIAQYLASVDTSGTLRPKQFQAVTGKGLG